MGTWGVGLWSDDTAADVRTIYREALEDGLSDAPASERVLGTFTADLGDRASRAVVWLALAAVQSSLGRLDDDVRDRAIMIIDSGVDLDRFAPDARLMARRKAILDKLKLRLLAEQPARKKVRRPPRRVTALVPGDIVGYRADSGHWYLLVVRRLHESRYGTFPCVTLLAFEGRELPAPKKLARLKERPKGKGPQGSRPAEPWWSVDGIVMQRRGHDYADHGFELVARVSDLARPEEPKPKSYSSWEFWQNYLNRQDVLFVERRGNRRRPSLG